MAEVSDKEYQRLLARIEELEAAVAEHERTEKALRESEEKYRNLVKHANDGIGIVQEGVCVFVNPRLAEITGRPVEELIGTPFLKYVHPTEIPELADRYERRMAGEEVPQVYETIIKLADGTDRHLEINANLITFQGKPADFAIIRDVTKRVQAEKVLERRTERLLALTAQFAEVEEAERQRLARELHDQVGQNLTALGLNLTIIRAQIAEETSDSVRSCLDDSLSLLERVTERIRTVMANLRPLALDDYGLVAALLWYGDQLAKRTGICITVEGEELSPPPAARVENTLFRIAQEALTNVAKHAQATRATVTLEEDNGSLRLVIVDDGIGFEHPHSAEFEEQRGWGLLTMAERAEAVGGYCRIESVPRKGTQVIVEVPL